MIIADTKEKEGHCWEWDLSNTPFVDMLREKLKYGDYTIDCIKDSNFLYLEKKKSAGEVYSNLISKDWNRFKKRLEEIRDFKYKFIICEFNYNDIYYRKPKKLRISPDVLASKLIEIQMEYGVNIIFASNKAKYVAMSLMKKVYNEWKRNLKTNAASKPKVE